MNGTGKNKMERKELLVIITAIMSTGEKHQSFSNPWESALIDAIDLLKAIDKTNLE